MRHRHRTHRLASWNVRQNSLLGRGEMRRGAFCLYGRPENCGNGNRRRNCFYEISSLEFLHNVKLYYSISILTVAVSNGRIETVSGETCVIFCRSMFSVRFIRAADLMVAGTLTLTVAARPANS